MNANNSISGDSGGRTSSDHKGSGQRNGGRGLRGGGGCDSGRSNSGRRQAGRGRGDKHSTTQREATKQQEQPGYHQELESGARLKPSQISSASSYSDKKSTSKRVFPPHWSLEECLRKYNAKDPNVIRGTLRVLPAKDAAGFCSCDRGSQVKDVMIDGPKERNRALNGDVVYVELLPEDSDMEQTKETVMKPSDEKADLPTEDQGVDDLPTEDQGGDVVQEEWWQDDNEQVRLWDPVVPLRRVKNIPKEKTSEKLVDGPMQRRGRVVHVVFPNVLPNEIRPTERASTQAARRVVGTLKRLQRGTTLLIPSNKSLEHFRLSNSLAQKFKDAPEGTIFQAKYIYGTWKEDCIWPPCTDLEQLGHSGNIEDETVALLIENDVDHGDFPVKVLEECETVVEPGQYANGCERGWKPTQDMIAGRRDYRQKRIITIDPTTAKDLDDALHITDIGKGQVEIGVHIADVSHFVRYDSSIDIEAQRRCTTVYLVDRVIPMLPKALCEVACSLNPGVERLAFSCVWKMNRDGTLVKDQKVWYGRSVIKSCAKLDYATAQNIIDGKVGIGESHMDDELWPRDRRPIGGHAVDEVAADVRLMNEIAQARRRLRFRNGAISLNKVKLTFKLDNDGETPMMCEPYTIRESNKLIEEYMLLANYLVAQRLVTHAGGRALLRNHNPPAGTGLEKAAALAMEALGFRLDISSSEGLQKSLNLLSRECQDEIILQCVTETLKTPMKPAKYVAAGQVSSDLWAHFALHIPYYTHFTSPIRRYADVIVHRLLQATLDGIEAVQDFPMEEKAIKSICDDCNDKKEGSRKAQERSDVVFLALYLRRFPMTKVLGVVLSVGLKAFTVFLPSLGESAIVYLQEHTDWINYEAYEAPNTGNHIRLKRIKRHKEAQWQELLIKNFAKVSVSCKCSEHPPLAVKLELEGPWIGNG